MLPILCIAKEIHLSPCRPAVIWAEAIVPPHQTQDPPILFKSLIDRAATVGDGFWPEGLKARVRRMLRHGRYRACGRAKPCSEFLLQAAREGRFPLINAPVDACNTICLESGFPSSIFDADLSGTSLLLRRGRSGERYVFNSSGQEIDLTDLLLVAKDIQGKDVPCGNPVKDSMTTKVRSNTQKVVAVLYAPIDEPVSVVSGWAERYAELFSDWCGTDQVGYNVIEPES